MVDSTADTLGDVQDGQITLREAVAAANIDAPYGDVTAGMLTSGGADTIQFSLLNGSVITPSHGAFGITGSLTIVGLGSDQLTIDAEGSSNIFSISNEDDSLVSISGMTLTNGNGGGIYSGGNLALEDITVMNCESEEGGGIYLQVRGENEFTTRDAHEVTINNCKIIGNSAENDGGGIYALVEGGKVSITNSIISDNHLDAGGTYGAGIYVEMSNGLAEFDELGEFSITRSEVSENTGGAQGGGIFIDMYKIGLGNGPPGSVLIDQCWIHHNQTLYAGGGVRISAYLNDFDPLDFSDVSVSIRDTTVSNNRVTQSNVPLSNDDEEDEGGGGGISIQSIFNGGIPPVLEIVNCTISRNEARWGGGLHLEGPINVRHSTIVHNLAGGQYGGEFEEEPIDTGGGGVLIHSAGNWYAHVPPPSGPLEIVLPGYLPSFSHCIIARNQHVLSDADPSTYSPNIASTIGDWWFDLGNDSRLDGGELHVEGFNIDYTIIDDLSGPLATNAIGYVGELIVVPPHVPMPGIDDPLLDQTLQDNGGPTLPGGGSVPTHKLRCGSAAIDHGDPSFSDPLLPDDQRGPLHPRVYDAPVTRAGFGPIDIGAFELAPPDLPSLAADFDGDLDVDGDDLAIWRDNYGKREATNADGDADGDGDVDGQDLDAWRFQFGDGVTGSIDADFNDDGQINGSDFMIWQQHIGLQAALPGEGDADGDQDVDGTDFMIWQVEVGQVGDSTCAGWVESIHLLDNFLAATELGKIVVSTLVDENDGDYTLGDLSLREAIYIASQIAGPDEIVFASDVRGSIRVATQLSVASDVTITGPGANLLTIDASAGDTNLNTHGNGIRAFNISSGSTVTIKDLTITGGDTSGDGGGVLTAGALTLNGVVVAGNYASGDGGGVFLDSTGTISVLSSTIDGNEAAGGGGGLYAEANNGVSVFVERSTISNNEAQTGGGIHYFSVATTTTATSAIRRSTISGNRAESGGGVTIENAAGAKSNVLFANVTIANNEANGSSPGGVGGGIHNVNVSNTNSGSVDAIALRNSILAGNTSLNTAFDEGSGSLGGHSASPSNYNLIAVSYTGLGVTHATNGNKVGVAANIGPLADNGGPTKTHALLSTSPAIDAGDTLTASGNGTFGPDQRGRLRHQFVDMGAFESGLVVSTNVDESDGNYAFGDLSLREALALAAATGVNQQIEFDSSIFGQTITLASGLSHLSITGNVEILGPGVDQMTIHAYDPTPLSNNFDGTRVFAVSSGVTSTISGVTITGGDVNGGAGGIYNEGNLTLDRVAVVDNATNLSGGGVWVSAGGVLSVLASTIDGNSSGGSGGGIGGQFNSTLTIADSTISNNVGVFGGGLHLFGNGPAVTARINNSTFSGNTAGHSAGAINVQNAIGAKTDLTIANSTITDNHATGAGSWGVAGGIYNINLSNTVSSGVTDAITLFNTIVAGNVSDYTAYDEGWGTLNGTSVKRSANNLIGMTYSNVGVTNGTERNLVGVTTAIDPRLGALAENGGLTRTHALLSGSPAIDAGSNEQVDLYVFDYDQRRQSRVRDGNLDGLLVADVGAYEVDADEFFASVGA